MIIIVGLGNPGKKYAKTRHNFGFQAVDEFYRKNKNRHLFSNFQLQKETSSLISEGKFNNQKIILAKPQTFMNNSGKSVKSLIRKYFKNLCQFQALASIQRRFENLWVIHDDVDLPVGKIRISIARGSAGHKGVESIIKELGTKNFVRFRIGICPQKGKPKNDGNFVLQKFSKKEEKIVKEVIRKTAEAIELSLKDGTGKAMAKYNE